MKNRRNKVTFLNSLQVATSQSQIDEQNNRTHDLYDLMNQITQNMQSEYTRIRRNSSSNPSHAGIQGEKNWKELIEGWIPSGYKVVTGGVIINEKGLLSPQVDVLILKESYPEKLLSMNNYLSAGVVAAFECKNTLTAADISKAVINSKKIKELYPKHNGTPYKELYAPIIYGLLAHSHSWKGENSTPEENIADNLIQFDESHISHPRQCLDIVCVSDLSTWTLYKNVISLYTSGDNFDRFKYSESGYIHRSGKNDKMGRHTSIGDFLYSLISQMSWINPDLRDIYYYYHLLGLISQGISYYSRLWDISDIYSNELINGIKSGKLVPSNLYNWSEWQQIFNHS